MAQNAQQSLPGNSLLFAKSLTQISKHEQLMRHTALTKCAAAYSPPTNSSGKDHLHRMTIVTRRGIEARRQTQFFPSPAQQPRRRLGQQFFAGTIYESQPLRTIERK